MFARSRAATRAPPRAVGDDERRRRRRRRERRAMPRRRATGVRFAPRERDYPPHPTRASASAATPRAPVAVACRRARSLLDAARAPFDRPRARFRPSIGRFHPSIEAARGFRSPIAHRPSPIGRVAAARAQYEDDRKPRASRPRSSYCARATPCVRARDIQGARCMPMSLVVIGHDHPWSVVGHTHARRRRVSDHCLSRSSRARWPAHVRASASSVVDEHGGHGGVVSHRYSHVGEHGGRARERHHERRSAHRRRLARVRPGGECDLGGLSRTGVFDDEWGGTRAAWVVYDSWR